jgi:sigma-54 dependent transcriptional regulator, acetoin dehydrogenase operon transcriptional activator AcoR
VNASASPSTHHGHADRVLQVVQGGPHSHETDIVTQSWLRCVNQYHLHPERLPEAVGLARGELDDRRAHSADVIACARYEMTTLFQQLADNDSAVLLTDTDGVILHMAASPVFGADAGRLGMRVGMRWGEADLGTNGLGTCLAAARPVSVRRDEHFFTQLTHLTCSAVPLYDPAGQVAAVLDVTSRSDLQQQHVLVLLGMTARMIENRLLDVRQRLSFPVHFHSRPEFVHTLHEGKLAVAEDGRVLAANRSALFQLNIPSVAAIQAMRMEELFECSLEELLQRSANASYHPVVTYRANAALRFFAVARRPALSPEATGVLRAGAAGSGLSGGAVAHLGVPVQADKPTAVRHLVRTPRTAAAPAVMTFKDPVWAAHLRTANRVIARGTPLLLRGETGAGKEVFARAVHEASRYAAGAFVAVNCASLPESLIESELFGYRAGAFTGAQRTGRRGKVLQADGGTLFLDEIADMPLELQARLLRVLDERQVAPLGTEEVQPVDFQLISASHGDLPTRVREGRFREDLYYRLAGIELALPALRDRADKRELILQVLAEESAGQARLSADAEALLMHYPWPGNVRQLRHTLRAAAALAEGGLVGRESLASLTMNVAAPLSPLSLVSPLVCPAVCPVAPPPLAATTPGQWPTLALAEPLAAPALAGSATGSGAASGLNAIQAGERKVLLQLLEQQRWNVSNVAKAINVSRNTLYRKLHRLNIPVSHPG